MADQPNIPEKFLKPYDPKAVEGSIYEAWEASGYFNPDNLPPIDGKGRTEPFSIVLPPPNVTGTLHMGHAAMLAIEDIIVRYKRMRGFKTVWVPGTDSAAIATQSKVEDQIKKKEGKSRHDLGRDELLKRIDAFVEESKNTIIGQVRRMGSSVDWSRYAYTMDDTRYAAVMEAFVRMYNAGLIYRGNRIVNWDPKGQTTISDDEIVYVEEKTKFYYLKYGPFTIGTARPETKFGDKYVVMHPDDERYADYTDGQQLELEWINGPIVATVIKDPVIDREFGTGVMTITPWHSTEDFDIAERHNLDKEQVIDERGKLLPIAGEFAGLKIADAREKIIEKLRAKGLVVKEEDYTHNIATAERTGGIIEPQIKLQWFVDVDKPIAERGNKSLKQLMRESVESGKVAITPPHFEKTYYHWIDNLRPWCISRQIWFGHRIPVWYRSTDAHGKQEMKVQATSPGAGWEQDPDTLDTWFSSGLWTFSTLGWPAQTPDLTTYHPTDLLETGYDILFFWVARMILMSQFLLGEVPFKNVYLHGLVRDGKGRKMSKSLGNIIDPVEMIDKYGADAVRLSLIMGAAPGNDLKLDEQRIRGYKNFANKIWNIGRFVLTHGAEGELMPELVKEFDAVAAEVTRDIDAFRLDLAADKVYHYVWDRFAAQIVEESKGKPEYGATLTHIYTEALKLLHPFMPYVTEEIWRDFPHNTGDLLMVAPWPQK